MCVYVCMYVCMYACMYVKIGCCLSAVLILSLFGYLVTLRWCNIWCGMLKEATELSF